MRDGRIRRTVSIAAGAWLSCVAAWPQTNVLTANYGNGRTNSNLQETILNAFNVNTDSFGKLGAFPVDGQIYVQPLHAGGVQVNGAPRNVVYVATMHNTVYAIDADAPRATAPLWRVNVGRSVASSFLGFSDVLPEVGILGTPVIDLSRNAIYFVADTFENGNAVFRLHALDLSDGHEKLGGPVVIQAAVNGDGEASDGGVVAFDAAQHLQRPGLLLANDTVYAAFGSHADSSPTHGWVMGYDPSNLQRQKAVLNTTPNGGLGSIWQSGRGIAADAAGNIYAVTGNGDYDGLTNFSQSFLKLGGGLNVLDWFTPENWADLSDNDEDLGSLGPMLIPGTKLLIGGDKAGNLYVVNEDQMGRLGGRTGSPQIAAVNNSGIFNSAYWPAGDGTGFVYIQEQGDKLKAYRLANGQLETTPSSMSADTTADIPYQGMTVSSKGAESGTALLWMTTGIHGEGGVPGTLHAFDATDVSKEIWNSDASGGRDALGRFAKFANPTVVNGKVFVPTFSNELAIYGPSASGGDAAPEIAAVVNGASYAGGAVSPGEVVAIFGLDLGTGDLVSAGVDEFGRFPSELAGTRVYFDGIAAPLLYVSATQIGAIAPTSVSGDATKVQVQYLGQLSPEFAIGAGDAAPAIFSLDNSGSGRAALLNQDGTLNSPDNPAEPDSVVALYATGLGQTMPALDDGKVTALSLDATALPRPLTPVTAQIEGQDAVVQYAGAAPGIVAGVFQVNVKVPATVQSNQQASLSIQIGNHVSQTSVWLAVK